jgi:hypothetical protein
VRCPRSKTTHGQTNAGPSFLAAVTPKGSPMAIATVLVLFVMFAAMVWALAR